MENIDFAFSPNWPHISFLHLITLTSTDTVHTSFLLQRESLFWMTCAEGADDVPEFQEVTADTYPVLARIWDTEGELLMLLFIARCLYLPHLLSTKTSYPLIWMILWIPLDNEPSYLRLILRLESRYSTHNYGIWDRLLFSLKLKCLILSIHYNILHLKFIHYCFQLIARSPKNYVLCLFGQHCHSHKTDMLPFVYRQQLWGGGGLPKSC